MLCELEEKMPDMNVAMLQAVFDDRLPDWNAKTRHPKVPLSGHEHDTIMENIIKSFLMKHGNENVDNVEQLFTEFMWYCLYRCH